MGDLALVVRRFGSRLLQDKLLSAQQAKVLLNICRCRTAALGWHEERCDNCSAVRYSYNSCGDRHCPKCQNTKQALWVEDLMAVTLPIQHFHVVFTAPHGLNVICLWDMKLFYNTLFDAVWSTLRSFGYTHYGTETGCIAVLHTWGQNQSLHPHIHCLIPAAGLNLRGQWKTIGINGKYLFPIGQLSETFKGKFTDSLERQLRKKGVEGFNRSILQARKTPWVVHCEPPMASADKVIHYLGQYINRTAITNQRILQIDQSHVTFIAKNYRDKATKRPVRLEGVEFLKRFTRHILPKRLVRIRRFGIYNPRVIRNHDLKFVSDKPDIDKLVKMIRPESKAQRILRLTGWDITLCPHCKKGHLHTTKTVPRIRSPAKSYQLMLMTEL